jgi:hypothetical protein
MGRKQLDLDLHLCFAFRGQKLDLLQCSWPAGHAHSQPFKTSKLWKINMIKHLRVSMKVSATIVTGRRLS